MAKQKESLGSRSARTFSVLTIGRIISLIIGVASIIIIARLLGPVEYGVFTLAYAFFLLVSATSNFGFGVYLTKHLSEAEDKKDNEAFARALGAGYLSIIIVGRLLTVIGIGVSGYVASVFQAQGVTQLILILVSSIIFFAMLYGTSDYALIGAGKNAMAMSLEIFENIVLLVASLMLIWMGYGVSGAIVGILISYVAAAGVGTYFIFRFAHRSMRVRINWPTLKEIKSAFKFSIPIAAYNFLNNSVTNFGTLFLGLFASTYILGNYGIASRASTILNLFYTTTAVTLLPTLTIAVSRNGKKAESKRIDAVYNRALVYSVIASTPLIAYIGVFSAPLIYLLISHSFGSAPLYLSLMAFGTMIGLAGIYAMNLFVALGKTSKLLTYGVICFFIQLITLLVLVPMLGAVGAIISLFFIDSLSCCYFFLRGARTVLGMRTDYNKLLRAFASNLLLIVVFAFGLLDANFVVELVYGLAALIVSYPFFLILLRAIEKEDVQVMREATEKLPALSFLLNPFLSYFGALIKYMQ